MLHIAAQQRNTGLFKLILNKVENKDNSRSIRSYEGKIPEKYFTEQIRTEIIQDYGDFENGSQSTPNLLLQPIRHPVIYISNRLDVINNRYRSYLRGIHRINSEIVFNSTSTISNTQQLSRIENSTNIPHGNISLTNEIQNEINTNNIQNIDNTSVNQNITAQNNRENRNTRVNIQSRVDDNINRNLNNTQNINQNLDNRTRERGYTRSIDRNIRNID